MRTQEDNEDDEEDEDENQDDMEVTEEVEEAEKEEDEVTGNNIPEWHTTLGADLGNVVTIMKRKKTKDKHHKEKYGYVTV